MLSPPELRTRKRPAAGGPAGRSQDHCGGQLQSYSNRRLMAAPRVPHDLEAELSVLAELAAPTYVLHALYAIDADCFYDERHKRIYRAALSTQVDDLSPEDRAYLANAVKYAHPLHAGSLASFLDCADRRRELFVLEHRRLEVLGVA